MWRGVLVAILFLIPVQGFAQTPERTVFIKRSLSFEMGSRKYCGAPTDFSQPFLKELRLPAQDVTRERSPVKAALLSLVLPGAGQWYAGSKWKALAFAAADVSLLLGNVHFNDGGDEIDAEFRAYADLHWNKSEYLDWLSGLSQSERDRLSHGLPETKTQQYYEMIGKYEQFVAGWPDSDGSPLQSQMRMYFMARQDASNSEYKKAELLANMMILNRVISAVEAVVSIRRNNSQIRPGLSMKIDPGGRRLMPAAYVQLRW